MHAVKWLAVEFITAQNAASVFAVNATLNYYINRERNIQKAFF
jgi:hypothetical protein